MEKYIDSFIWICKDRDHKDEKRFLFKDLKVFVDKRVPE